MAGSTGRFPKPSMTAFEDPRIVLSKLSDIDTFRLHVGNVVHVYYTAYRRVVPALLARALYAYTEVQAGPGQSR